MIGVGVGQKHDVHIAEPVVDAAIDGPAGIPQDSHSGGVFKQQRPVVAAEFSRMTSERRHLDDCDCVGGPGFFSDIFARWTRLGIGDGETRRQEGEHNRAEACFFHVQSSYSMHCTGAMQK